VSLTALAKFGGQRAAQRVLPGAWLIYVWRSAWAAGGHVGNRLTPRQRRRIWYLVRRSRGRPSNLTLKQRAELRRLLNKIEPIALAQAIAAELSPLPWPKPPG